MAKKISRETNHVVKPMITDNKKKKANKKACRINFDEYLD